MHPLPLTHSVSTYQLLYELPAFVKRYMRLLAVFSGKKSMVSPGVSPPTSQQEEKRFKEFRALHAQVQKMQLDTAAILQNLLPCGHRVLPINIEESLFEGLLKNQLIWLESHAHLYKMLKELHTPADECEGLGLEHIKSFTSACRHLEITMRNTSRKFISRMSFEDCLEDIELIGGKAGNHSAVFISSTAVLASLLPFLFSGSRCFFPVTVNSVVNEEGRRITLHPVLWGEPHCSRLRAKQCYTSIYRKAFLRQRQAQSSGPREASPQPNASNSESQILSGGANDNERYPPASPTKSVPQKRPLCTPHSPLPVRTDADTSLDETEEDTLVSNLQIDEDVPGTNDQPLVPSSALEDVIAQCVVVEARQTAIEDIEPPASPDSTPEVMSPSSPNDHLDAPEALPVPPPVADGPTDRTWSCHRLGEYMLLLNSSPVLLTRSSCATCFHSPTAGGDKNCLFWPNCSEIWENSQTEPKMAYLTVKPEYLLPWGCERLSDDELWECYLGSLLDCADSPHIVNLRVNVSSGDLVFAEYQSLDDLLKAYPSFSPNKNLSVLSTILSELQTLPEGEYLLSSGQKNGSTVFEIYQSVSEGKTDIDAASGEVVDLKETCGVSFAAAIRRLLTSHSPPAGRTKGVGLDVGPTWRVVARLGLDFNIPSGIDEKGGLLLPGLLLSSSASPVMETNSSKSTPTPHPRSAKRRPSKLRKTSSSPHKPS
ncbi:hypothetical protein AAHC03_013318 [Spirometra sp. Aus1]